MRREQKEGSNKLLVQPIQDGRQSDERENFEQKEAFLTEERSNVTCTLHIAHPLCCGSSRAFFASLVSLFASAASNQRGVPLHYS